MANITVNYIKNEKDWENFLNLHSEANFLQSWNWGKFHESLGKKVYRSGFYREGNLTGLMLSIVENAKRGRYLTVPAGPIIDWRDPDQVTAYISEIQRIAKIENCAFVRVRPQLQSNEFSKTLFKTHGFINAPMHLHAELTSQLDITLTEEELMANMRKTTRYEIRKANTLGINITSTDNTAGLKEFYDLQIETSRRQNFVPFSYKFLEEQFKVFAETKNVLLYTAKFDGKLLAQAYIIFYGAEAAYHYGASTEEGRKFPGAYLIQWEAIKEAKRR